MRVTFFKVQNITNGEMKSSIQFTTTKKPSEMISMTMGKFARCLTVGFLLAIFSIGLLPLLLIYNVSEMSGLTEFDASPVLLLITRFIDGKKADRHSEK
jgi:hypothetical protein